MAASVLVAMAVSLLPAQPHAAARVPVDVPGTLIDTLKAVTATDATTSARAAAGWIDRMQVRLASRFPDARMRRDLLARIRAEARLAGLAPEIVLAVIQVESAFKADAVSPAGARGLMQVMPFWKRVIGRADDDLLDPGTNLRYGCTILAHYLRLENGDLTRALARYNGSLGETWYPERVMHAWVEKWLAPSA